ncbi:hypothetical protein MTO96_034486 [Rhipicephalus appendiculatus]
MDLPDDGVCDFIIFDSLGDPFDPLGQPATGSFKDFQTLAAMGKTTQYGVSIKPLDVSAFLTLLNTPSAIAWSMEKLWSHNIYHWGILSIRKTIMAMPGHFEKATIALAKAKEISKPSPTKRGASYTFLGFYGETNVGCDEAVQLMTTHHRPNVIIILGHISFKESDVRYEVSNYTCIMIPPSLYKIPSSVQNTLVYGHTIMEAAKLLTCIVSKLQPLPKVGISFTMSGRYYRPKKDDANVKAAGNYSVFDKCFSFDAFTNPQRLCNRTGYEYYANLARDSDYLYSFTYDKGRGRQHTIVFDDLQSIKEKICHVIYNSTLVNYTFVAYDVNDDYSAFECPKAQLGIPSNSFYERAPRLGSSHRCGGLRRNAGDEEGAAPQCSFWVDGLDVYRKAAD